MYLSITFCAPSNRSHSLPRAAVSTRLPRTLKRFLSRPFYSASQTSGVTHSERRRTAHSGAIASCRKKEIVTLERRFVEASRCSSLRDQNLGRIACLYMP